MHRGSCLCGVVSFDRSERLADAGLEDQRTRDLLELGSVERIGDRERSRAQRCACVARREAKRELGVKHLVAVAGGSYGGFLTFQWGISHPDEMDGLVVVVSSPDGGANPQSIRNIEAQLARATLARKNE